MGRFVTCLANFKLKFASFDDWNAILKNLKRVLRLLDGFASNVSY